MISPGRTERSAAHVLGIVWGLFSHTTSVAWLIDPHLSIVWGLFSHTTSVAWWIDPHLVEAIQVELESD
eukprot:365991-Chlamydomonas_euryale.AAC.3